MSTASSPVRNVQPAAVPIRMETPAVGQLLADLADLTKPRIAVLVLFTVAVGGLLAGGTVADWVTLLHAVVGTALLASAASTLNQYLERHSDARMARTENRPLPSGRMQPAAVLVFGGVLGVLGVLYLALTMRHAVPVAVAGFTFFSYVFIYTPLKRVTWLNTVIGAVPGALPPVIGWTAVRGSLDAEAGVLFLIVFFWQLPHFLAIAWIYRDDYARAGHVMLPVIDVDGRRTARQMVGFCLALLAVSFLPAFWTARGELYLAGAVLLGLGFLATTLSFAREHSQAQARRVLRASLVYLPALLALLLLDGFLR